MDYVSKAAQAKLKDFETLCQPQKYLLQKSHTSILKQKKKVSSQQDTMNKLKNTSFTPKYIVKKIEITASKRAMDSRAFKIISDRNKARQLQHD